MNTVTKLYRVAESSSLVLRLTVGHGQPAVTDVSLENKELVRRAEGNLELPIPGSGAELKGKKLLCTTIVTDIRKETDQTSVTYELLGGQSVFRHSLEETSTGDGSVVFFTATFILHG